MVQRNNTAEVGNISVAGGSNVMRSTGKASVKYHENASNNYHFNLNKTNKFDFESKINIVKANKDEEI